MTNPSSAVLNDIIESIKVRLHEVAEGQEQPPTIDDLTDDFQGSGEETRREWVVKAANELVVLGLIEPGTDPDRPLVPSKGFLMQVAAQRAALVFPNDKDCIELIPVSPGSKPVWRLVIWDLAVVSGQRIHTIKDVAEADFERLATVLRMAPWRHVWHAKVVNEAIRKLAYEPHDGKIGKMGGETHGDNAVSGKTRVGGDPDKAREESELQFRVYEDAIRVKRRSDDEVFEYDLRSCTWGALRALPSGKHL